MPEIIVRLDKDEGNFSDLAHGKELITVHSPIYLTALEGGMQSGKASVVLGFTVGGNKFILAETSLRLFLLSAEAVAARFPGEARELPFYAQGHEDGNLTLITRPGAEAVREGVEILGRYLSLQGGQQAERVRELIAFLESVKDGQ